MVVGTIKLDDDIYMILMILIILGHGDAKMSLTGGQNDPEHNRVVTMQKCH